ncbi:MAG: L-seryl-tRNA(Sec) selenium transferase, partial [Kocuria rhizophila]
MTGADPRSRIPRTDQLLALPAVQAARARLSDQVIRTVVTRAQDRARRSEIAPEDVQDTVITDLAERRATSLTSVLNATGVVIHTNLGRAPLSPAAREALLDASGYVDV